MMRRATRLLAGSAMVFGASGCYTYSLPTVAPAPGAPVSLSLTDRGRAALVDRVGPEMDRLVGTLVSTTDSNYVLTVLETVTLRGVSAKWSGESITLSRDLVGGVRVRTFSRGRTLLVAGTGGAAAVAALFAGGLVGGTSVVGDPLTPPGGPGNSTKTASSKTSSGSTH
jgi:hypothetical protein